jgi:hypothetical protein
MYRANYPVDNPSDYWKISIYIVFLDHLVEEIGGPLDFEALGISLSL